MPLSNASRLADFGTGIGTAGAIIQVDNANQRLGVGTTAPTATLGVAGIVSATAFYGDGSNLDGVASAGLGTALSETEFDPLAVIYQTSDTLSVGATITVDPPNATTKVAYTQYAEVKLEGDADLIVAEGDDFIPDILGLSTEGSGGGAAYGNNVFNTVYADNIEAVDGRGAPTFPKGIYVTSGVSTFTGNISIGGTLTYEDVTNVDSIGIITARQGIKVTAGGINAVGVVTATSFKGDGSLLTGIDATQIQKGNTSVQTVDTGSDGHVKMTTEGGERLRIGSSGQIGLSGANYGTDGQVLVSKGASAAVQWADAAGGTTADAFWQSSDAPNSTWNNEVWGGAYSSTLARKSGFPTKAGIQMSDSSGVFTFPETGTWRIDWNIKIVTGMNDWWRLYMQESTDSGSTWDGDGVALGGIWYGWCGNYTNNYDSISYHTTTNVTNVSTYRVRGILKASAAFEVYAKSWIIFTKLT